MHDNLVHDNPTFGIVAFTQLPVVYNPLGAMPMFASLTVEDSPRERLRTALAGVATSIAAMVVLPKALGRTGLNVVTRIVGLPVMGGRSPVP